MNYKAVAYILGWILVIEGALMLTPFAVSLIYGEEHGAAFAVIAAVCIVTGILIVFRKPKRMTFYSREGFVVTALAWILMSVFGCLPFVMNGDIPSFTDALFETVSGFTTTGTSILDDVEALSHASLFWRSLTHWIGGMGVLVFLLALIPMTGGGTHMNIMRAESPGPTVSKLLPKVRQTAFALYAIYLALTIAEFIMLVIGRMPVFEAITTAVGTAGTGGFGVKADSMASYSPYIQWVVTAFMIMFGINFGVYFLLATRKFKSAAIHEEARYYLLIILGAAAIIAIAFLMNGTLPDMAWGDKIRHIVFQCASLITTTGFTTIDYDTWPQLALMVLLTLMFIGACAGSTGGGIKVSRVLIMCRSVKNSLTLFFHPKRVVNLRSEGKTVPPEIVQSVSVYMIAYIIVYVVSIFIVSLDNYDFTTNFTAIAATINNIGPGLSKAGPTESFSMFSPLSKYVMIFDMLAGRLELYPMLILLSPEFWKSLKPGH